MSFLKKLEPVTDVDFERRVSALQYIIENKEKGRIIALIILYFLFSILVLAECVYRRLFDQTVGIQRMPRGGRSLLRGASYCRPDKDEEQQKEIDDGELSPVGLN